MKVHAISKLASLFCINSKYEVQRNTTLNKIEILIQCVFYFVGSNNFKSPRFVYVAYCN